ncbi:cysteine--tRNA ligase [Uliginosibacterium sp. H3]|uniref:Cysteine--tRNA ligase n=1 Tax=Uliginosibacterium silvisoli TaxID=3114758 RepID=A0ABU6K9F0_9RHOO|nr:cysteine--tRNA ligase [Uliginosibacterium sp. H3]
MLKIYNTLARQKQDFTPIEAGKVRMYVCGLTVYDFFHIGNARTLTVFDMVYRWLSTTGYQVKYVRNITDVDDKIIDRANKNGESIDSLTGRMVQAMHEDTDRLMMLRPTAEPRATEHIGNMLGLIGGLVDKGKAYPASNGDVYYAVREFGGYGKLSGKSIDDLRAGERVAVDGSKRDPLDFVLWKAAKPHEPHWHSHYGEGRPGWHIECSAMSKAELGETIDIHGGGWDLQFPHHENEIAQSEGASGKPFVNYWMHAAFLNMDNEKMSKSLGNVFTTREILAKLDPVQGGETVRFFLLRGHYRSEINYTWDLLLDSRASLLSLYTALRDVPPAAMQIDWNEPHAARFREVMNDDFNTPMAFAVLHELRAEVNRTKSAELSGLLKALGNTIGLLTQDPARFVQGGEASGDDAAEIDALILQRQEAKKARNFAESDRIRDELKARGIVLEDGAGGTTWRRA